MRAGGKHSCLLDVGLTVGLILPLVEQVALSKFLALENDWQRIVTKSAVKVVSKRLMVHRRFLSNHLERLPNPNPEKKHNCDNHGLPA